MRPHFRLNISGFCTLWRKYLFSCYCLHARHPERRRGEVLSVALRNEECRGRAQTPLVSSARMLDGTIDTLTLVEG